MTNVTSYPKERIKVLLLENIHPSAAQMMSDDGLSVEVQAAALGEQELCAKIEDVHLLGIRSKTRVTPKVLESARRLLSVGCFCIGTNQVALEAARDGVTVNCIPPGRIMSEQIRRKYPEEFRREHSAREIPAGRYGEPEELACLAVFLASPIARYITGAVLPVDGGLRRYAF